MTRLLPLLLLAACDHDKTGDTAETSTPPVDCSTSWRVDTLLWEGTAPWDGIAFEADPCTGVYDADEAICKVQADCGTTVHDGSVVPYVVDATGAAVTVELRAPPYVSEPTFVAPGGFTPGNYKVIGANGLDHGWNEGFVIEPVGRDAAFDPATLEGKLWHLDPASVDGSLVPSIFEVSPNTHLYLTMNPRDGGKSDFNILYKNDKDPERIYWCNLLVGTGDLSATGEFTWTTDSLALDSTPPIQAYDVSFHFGFSADGTAVGGVQAGMIADTWDLGMMVSDDGTDTGAACQLVTAFGGDPCQPCPGDPTHPTCDAVAMYGATMALSTEVPPVDLEDCAVLWSMPEYSCDLGCASAGGRSTAWAGLLLAGITTLARRRGRNRATLSSKSSETP